MGLDLVLETAPRHDSPEEDWIELAYGRKTWSIAHFFERRCIATDGDWEYRVTRADWNAYVKYIQDWNLERIKKVLDFDNYDNVTEADLDYLMEFVSNLGEPVLGYDWDARAMIEWYEANKVVQEAFNNDWYVRLIKSY